MLFLKDGKNGIGKNYSEYKKHLLNAGIIPRLTAFSQKQGN